MSKDKLKTAFGFDDEEFAILFETESDPLELEIQDMLDKKVTYLPLVFTSIDLQAYIDDLVNDLFTES